MSEQNTLISIKKYGETKYIRYVGYGYMAEGIDSNKPARIINYINLAWPFEKALEYGLSAWETDNSNKTELEVVNVTERELDEYLSAHPYIFESDISPELHCGTYFMIPRK